MHVCMYIYVLCVHARLHVCVCVCMIVCMCAWPDLAEYCLFDGLIRWSHHVRWSHPHWQHVKWVFGVTCK